MTETKFINARNELVNLIQNEGNPIREEATALLENIQSFHLKFFDIYATTWLDESDFKFSKLYKSFLNFDKKAGLFSEKLAMVGMDDQEVLVRPPTLDEYSYLAIYALHLSAHRETLRNLLRDAENRINSHREALNNRAILFIAGVSLVVAVAGILFTIINSNSQNHQNYFRYHEIFR